MSHYVPIAAKAQPIPKVTFIDNEAEFRWALLEDQMAFDKLHEGIKKFAQDGETLKDQLRKKMMVAWLDISVAWNLSLSLSLLTWTVILV